MLIDVHAHFYHDRSPRADWRERNASRLAAGEKIGITIHVASILGSWGRTSPTYFPSPADLPYGNDALLALARSEEHTSELQSQSNLVCRLLLEKKKKKDTSVPAGDSNRAHSLIWFTRAVTLLHPLPSITHLIFHLPTLLTTINARHDTASRLAQPAYPYSTTGYNGGCNMEQEFSQMVAAWLA